MNAIVPCYSDSWSAIEFAASRGCVVMQFLIDRGARYAARYTILQDSFNLTLQYQGSFHIAAKGGHEEVIKFLWECDSLDYLEDPRALAAAIRLAQSEGHRKLVSFL